MFWQAFNFIVSVFSEIIDFFFFTDLGGANMAQFIGGMFIFGIAWKVFMVFMGAYRGDSSMVSKESKYAQRKEYRKGKY